MPYVNNCGEVKGIHIRHVSFKDRFTSIFKRDMLKVSLNLTCPHGQITLNLIYQNMSFLLLDCEMINVEVLFRQTLIP